MVPADLARFKPIRTLLLPAAVLGGLMATLFVPMPARASIPPVAPVNTPGRVCMFNAPSGAKIGPVTAGHVGWAFRGSGNWWYFGATENTSGKPKVPPGGDTGSWSASGNFAQVAAGFRNSGPGHAAHYYTQYRCRNWPTSNASKAWREIGVQAHNGYNLFKNNCLDKSIAIFRAYGINNLPDGHFWVPVWPDFAAPWFPNHYFNDMLPGFERAQNL
jgi:hypothetical protein